MAQDRSAYLNAQTQAIAMQSAEAQKQREAQRAYAEQLGPQAGAAYLANPAAFMKTLEPYTLSPGQTRMVGAQSIAASPANLQWQDVGNNLVGFDPQTRQPAYVLPKTALTPYEAQGLNPEAFRQFKLAERAAGKQSVDLKVNTFTPASEEAQKQFMQSSRATYDQLKNAPAVLENIEKAKALIPEAKGFMGPGGPALLDAAKFLNNRIGTNINVEGIKSAEELRSRIFFQIMENLKKMDAQPSEMQQRMMQSALGNLGTDPRALGNVLDAYGDVIRTKVASHNREVRGAEQRGVKFPYDPVIDLRQQQGTSPPTPAGGFRIVR